MNIFGFFLKLFNGVNSKDIKPATHCSDVENDIYVMVNNHRTKIGLNKLSLNHIIQSEARLHSKNMAEKKTAYGHDGFKKRVNVIRKSAHKKMVGENVAYGYNSADSVVNGWLKSKGHRKNIETKYTHTGIGVYISSSGKYYFTQIFGA